MFDTPTLLQQAAHAAHSIEEAEDRAAGLARVVVAAARAGELGVARELAVDVRVPGRRAVVFAELALNETRPEQVAEDVAEAARALDQAPRWWPSEDWLSPDRLRMAMAERLVVVGQAAVAKALFGELGGTAEVAARLSLIWAQAAAGDAAAFGAPVAAAKALGDPLERADLLRDAALAQVARGDVQGAARIVLDLLVQGAPADRHAACLMGQELGQALAMAGAESLAERVLGGVRATVMAEQAEGDPPPEWALCALARSQHAAGLGAQGVQTLDLLVQQLDAEPLPLDGRPDRTWGGLMALSMELPALSGPLRTALRRRGEMPPDWLFVRAELERLAGLDKDADVTVQALALGFAPHAGELDGGWLACVAWARLGQVEKARALMDEVLQEVPPGRVVHVPGLDPAPVEAVLADAQRLAGDLYGAVDLARTLAQPGDRARALVPLAEAWPAEVSGDGPDVQDLCREALSALGDALVDTPGAPALVGELPARLARVLARAGHPSAAADAVRQALGWGLGLSDDVAVPMAARLEWGMRQAGHGDLADVYGGECARRVSGTRDPGRQCRQVLDWVAQRRGAIT